MGIEVGKPLPEDLKAALNENTNMSDWAVAANDESKVSPYTVRDIIKGFSVSEKSISTVYKLIEIAKKKIAQSEENLNQHKSIFDAYALTESE